jgi:hypothetical protein
MRTATVRIKAMRRGKMVISRRRLKVARRECAEEEMRTFCSKKNKSNNAEIHASQSAKAAFARVDRVEGVSVELISPPGCERI